MLQFFINLHLCHITGYYSYHRFWSITAGCIPFINSVYIMHFHEIVNAVEDISSGVFFQIKVNFLQWFSWKGFKQKLNHQSMISSICNAHALNTYNQEISSVSISLAILSISLATLMLERNRVSTIFVYEIFINAHTERNHLYKF